MSHHPHSHSHAQPQQPPTLADTLPLPDFLHNFKRFDIYRSIPKDLTEQTVAGASISLVTYALIALLFLSELISYIRVDTRHEMVLEHPGFSIKHSLHSGASSSYEQAVNEANLMRINFNITFPRMACAIAAIGVQDVLGADLDVTGQIMKYRTDSEGRIKYTDDGTQMLHGESPLSESIPEAQRDEGCSISGHVQVRKVPGNLHFTSSAHPDVLMQFWKMAQQQQQNPQLGQQQQHQKQSAGKLNTSHIIHSFYFGDVTPQRIYALNNHQTAVAPLNGATKWCLATQETTGMDHSYEYYLKVIPTTIEKLSSFPLFTYQFVSNSNEMVGRLRMPTIFFRYDIEPVRVRFREVRTSFAHFLVQCAAIIGGMVSVLGIVNLFVKGAIKSTKPGRSGEVHAVRHH